MAAIGTIRKHYGLLVIIIGLALLAFVLGDLFRSTGKGRTNNVAVVNGEKISYQDYSNLVDANIENAKRNGTLSNDDTFTLRNQTLDQMIRKIIMDKEFKSLGLAVSSDELFDQFTGENPNQYVRQSFTDANGNFDREAVLNSMRELQNLDPAYQAQWLKFEDAIKEERMNEKYDNLLKKSFYMPAKLAEHYYANKNDKRTAEVYAVRYTTVPDSTVVLTAQDNKAFYEANKNKYQTDETRSIDYIIFDVKPSQADRQDAMQFVADTKAGLAETTNVANFVAYNSDMPYDSTWKSSKDLPVAVENEIVENEVGHVFGPYENNGYFNVGRIMAKEDRSDSLMASHILIGYEGALRSQATRTKDEANKLADSLLNVAKKANDFEALATEFSDDPSAKTNNGDLGWFTDGQMVTDFNEFVQDNKVGTIGMVETPFGFHIIKVTDKNEPKPMARIAVIAREISASTATFQDVFSQANKFSTEVRNAEQFNKAVEEQGLSKRTFPTMRKNTNRITGLSNPREIVRWAFKEETKVGDISTIFDLENMYVIAMVTKAIPEGVTPMEEVAERYSYLIKKEKKGDMLVQKAAAYGTDYEKMINELGGEKTNVENITLEGRSFGNFGLEDKAIGTAMAMGENVYSPIIKGGNAMFVIKVTGETKAAATTDYSAIKREKQSVFNNAILNGSAYSALYDDTKVENNGILFF